MSARTRRQAERGHEQSAPLAMLAPRYSRSLQRGAYLTELRRHATGTVSLAVLDGTAVLYIEQARSLQGHSHATIARTGARPLLSLARPWQNSL